MDLNKRNHLIQMLSREREPQIISIREFFDGNDDPGSIGCNLLEHPGIEIFKSILVGLLDREDVEAVYAQIAELDPGPESWPFTDTVLIVGMISTDVLARILQPLEPDEVGLMGDIPEFSANRHGGSVQVAWWD
jgi:prepilin-type processing-associated H-X9-DG protein